MVSAASISATTLCSIDLLPTIAHLAGAPLPENPIDGANVWDLIAGLPGARNPNEYYALSTNTRLEAIITTDGKWKLHLPHDYVSLGIAGRDGLPGKYETRKIDLSLFELEKDPRETTDVSEKFPQVVVKLRGYAAEHLRRFYAAE